MSISRSLSFLLMIPGILGMLGIFWIFSVRPCRAAPPGRCRGPSVQQAVAAALNRLDEHASPKTLRSARHRLGWSALLPRLSTRLARSSGSTAYMDIYPNTRLDQNQYLALRWEVRATWDLARLIFDDRVLRISSRAEQLARWRQSAAEQVVQLYFERCRLLVMSEGVGSTRRDPVAQMQLKRVTALLDVMTGGLFSRSTMRPSRP